MCRQSADGCWFGLETRILPSLVATALVAFGCQEEPQIRRYAAPRVAPRQEGSPSEERMLLGAMCWQNGVGWFFRVVGPKDRLEKQRDAFRAFLLTLELTTEEARWRLPEDWRLEERRTPGRYATLRLGAGQDAPELVIVRFPPGQGGDIAGNVNRWRGMVGLPSLSAQEAEKLTSRLKSPRHEFVTVELSGPGPSR